MKKIALLVVSLVALTTVASAQGFGWGVKAGINVAGVTNAANGVGSMVGFTGGVFADYRFSDDGNSIVGRNQPAEVNHDRHQLLFTLGVNF